MQAAHTGSFSEPETIPESISPVVLRTSGDCVTGGAGTIDAANIEKHSVVLSAHHTVGAVGIGRGGLPAAPAVQQHHGQVKRGSQLCRGKSLCGRWMM